MTAIQSLAAAAAAVSRVEALLATAESVGIVRVKISDVRRALAGEPPRESAHDRGDHSACNRNCEHVL